VTRNDDDDDDYYYDNNNHNNNKMDFSPSELVFNRSAGLLGWG
jgi:hypothetical protein